MRVHLSCFGLLPTASSRRPVKRYNLLVPDIFPRTEPPFQDKVDSSIDRKIKKLADYLDKNPHRGPKVQVACSLTSSCIHVCESLQSFLLNVTYSFILVLGVTAIGKKNSKRAQSTALWLCQACRARLHALAGGTGK